MGLLASYTIGCNKFILFIKFFSFNNFSNLAFEHYKGNIPEWVRRHFCFTLTT